MDETVELSIDGKPVTGKVICKNLQEVGVEICRPFQGFQSFAPTIPVFASKYHRYVEPDGGLSKAGRQAAQKELQTIYITCRVFQRHRDELRAKYLHLYRTAIQSTNGFVTDEEYTYRKRELSHQLADRSIGIQQYETDLGEIETAHTKYLTLIHQVKESFLRFIELKYHVRISHQLLDQVVARFVTPRST